MPSARLWLTTLFTRRYPFISGCGTFANSPFVKILSGDSQETVLAKLDSGALMFAPLNDYVGRAAYFVGDLDRKISIILARIIRPGDTVLDVGANLGIVTLQLANLVGQAGTVHSFEPNPKIAQLLAQSVQSNVYQNVVIHKHALGVKEDCLELSIPRGNAGRASFNQSLLDNNLEKIQVPVHSLSSIAEIIGLNSVRLMKIDVEGFELQVLQGAEKWLSHYPPQAILFECNETSKKRQTSPVIELLLNAGYHLYGIPKGYFTIKLRVLEQVKMKGTAGHDMLAVHKKNAKEIVGLFDLER